MLKAYLLKSGVNIYYKDNPKNQNRTISLSDCVKKIMTNENDPVRKNLEVVIGIRNMASHLIVPEYANLLNDVFMACTKNYTNKLKTLLSVSIDEKFTSDYLTMFIPHNNPSVAIETKYGKEIVEKYLATEKFLQHSYCENSSNEKVDDSFAVSYELSFKTVKDASNADFTVSKSAPSKAQLGIIKVKETIDPEKTHPLSNSQLIQMVKEEMSKTNLTFVPVSEGAKKVFTSASFNLLNKEYKFKDNPDYAYKHSIGNTTSYTYSVKLVSKIINIFTDNPEILKSIKKC